MVLYTHGLLNGNFSAYNPSLASHCSSDKAQYPLNGPQGDASLAPFSFLVIPGGTIFRFVHVLHTGIVVILENSVTDSPAPSETDCRPDWCSGWALSSKGKVASVILSQGTCLGCGFGPAVAVMLCTLSISHPSPLS